MTWVITRLCRDCVDQGCVEVCPVDCIYVYDGEDKSTFPNQLYIDPEECINCGVCEPECPWEAIFEDEQVPPVFTEDTGLNAKILDDKDSFSVAEPAGDRREQNQVGLFGVDWTAHRAIQTTLFGVMKQLG
jgi:ferredoxin